MLPNMWSCLFIDPTHRTNQTNIAVLPTYLGQRAGLGEHVLQTALLLERHDAAEPAVVAAADEDAVDENRGHRSAAGDRRQL
eukprot:3884532-Pleurochrysis_carterae.AAC.1